MACHSCSSQPHSHNVASLSTWLQQCAGLAAETVAKKGPMIFIATECTNEPQVLAVASCCEVLQGAFAVSSTAVLKAERGRGVLTAKVAKSLTRAPVVTALTATSLRCCNSQGMTHTRATSAARPLPCPPCRFQPSAQAGWSLPFPAQEPLSTSRGHIV